MNFDFLNTNCFDLLVFKKNYYFKSKPFIVSLQLDQLNYFLTDRFVQHNSHIQDPSNWDVDKENKTAFFKAKYLISEIETSYHKFMNQELTDQINFLLSDEYGYLLPEVSHGTWELIEVQVSSLIMPNVPHLKNLSSEIIQDYLIQLQEGKELIGGLFIPKNDYYRLIDGYHRLTALKQFFSNEHFVSIISFQPQD